jgi:DNA phosphorothioation-associated putative methyltransferase
MLLKDAQFSEIALCCQNSAIGKRLPNALYIHCSAIATLDPLLQNYERQARIAQEITGATLVKFSTDKPKISYLFYPDFDRDPHPALQLSIVVDMTTQQTSCWDYATSDNPPILHRKETFVTSNYPYYSKFAHLTELEARLGLLDNSKAIGTRLEWQQRLDRYRIAFEGHCLVCSIDETATRSVSIDRHKAALARKTLSRPVRLALEAGLFVPETTFFDYGCGYGGDVQRIAERGYQSSGWDPYYRNDILCTPAEIVNLGYIINVIEDLEERRQALVKAWELTRQVLIVAAQVLIDDRDRGVVVYSDGIITKRNTFQKYYQQEELKSYIDRVLNVDAIPVGLGIYLIFRDENKAESFKLSRFRSRASTPRIQKLVRRFEDYEDLLAPLMEFITQRGRLPVKGELANELEIKQEFRTFHNAYKVILQVTDEREWDAIAEQRRQDILLYLALTRFDRRPTLRELSFTIREDIKALFGHYNFACQLADNMLFSLRNLSNIAKLARSSIGKSLRNSLAVHISALENLPPLLRLYEGCVSRTIGRLEEANVIRFFFDRPRIRYLVYPDFDASPHPILASSMEISLEDLNVSYRDFSDEENPPILHEKNKLVSFDHPLHEKFAKLTRQEKDWGLLENLGAINRLQGWLQCLEEHCATIEKNRVCWRKDADPYKVKLLRSQINARKKKQTH